MLDTVLGAPAAGIPVSLELIGDGIGHAGAAAPVGSGSTDADGRVGRLNADPLHPGSYRLTFSTGQYFAAQHGSIFYPRIVIEVTLFDRSHFHLPVLAGTYSYSTYLGS